MTFKQKEVIWALVWGSALFVTLLSAVGLAASDGSANWRFGTVQITDIGGGRIRLYMSLQNRGEPSSEPVHLYIAPGKASTISGPVAAVLTNHTQRQKSAVVDATVTLTPAAGSSAKDGYRLFLQVGAQVTDMMPVEKGQATPGDMDRMRFQK